MLSKKNDPLADRDVFLAYIEDKPAFFAWITNISPDSKKGWWHIRFVVLAVPVTTMTWILDNDQIRGEGFTMGDIPVRLEKVVAPPEKTENQVQEKSQKQTIDATEGGAKIISLFGNQDA